MGTFGFGRGVRLDAWTRRRLEGAFGHDLSAVRVHTDPTAGRLPSAVGAAALARGTDIVFAPGWYAPHTPAGRWLIGHEVAHLLQQRRPRKSDPVGRPRSFADLEAEADAAAWAVAAGLPFRI